LKVGITVDDDRVDSIWAARAVKLGRQNNRRRQLGHVLDAVDDASYLARIIGVLVLSAGAPG
jgi:hypothetical protein